MYEKQKRWREKNLEENRCPICGKRRTRHYYCPKCQRKHVERMRKQRAKRKEG